MAQWFQAVFGFPEKSYRLTQASFKMIDGPEGPGTVLKNTVNGREHFIGEFSVSSINELNARLQKEKAAYFERKKVAAAATTSSSTNAAVATSTSTTSCAKPLDETGGCTFKHLTGVDIRAVHRDPVKAESVIMVASQFNCLEMTGPGVSANQGITGYAFDPTQGPACALSCPAATAFRNYFAPNGKGQGLGGTEICTVDRVAKVVENDKHKFWKMQNGYLLPTSTTSMGRLATMIGSHQSSLARKIIDEFAVGIHWSTEVETQSKHRVCQVFASAVPVNYAKSTPSRDWASFGTLVLEGTFTATLLVAGCKAYQLGRRIPVYFTMIGGGAFTNRKEWIRFGMCKALWVCRDLPIDVYLAHHSTTIQSYYADVAVPTSMPTLPEVERIAGVEKSKSDGDDEDEGDDDDDEKSQKEKTKKTPNVESSISKKPAITTRSASTTKKPAAASTGSVIKKTSTATISSTVKK